MNPIFKNLQHRIAHILKWNTGTIEYFYSEDGTPMVGFRCRCGKLMNVERLRTLTVNTDGEIQE
jgi:hypothetical protein